MDDPDLIDVLTGEHRVLEGLFADVEVTTDRALRREALDAAIDQVRRHAANEEQFLYPATRAHLPAGDALADHELREHADADQLCTRLADLDDRDPAFDPLVSTMMTDVRDHVQEAEIELFPRLRDACSPETLRELGQQVQKAV